jgi:hypothetical protein
VDLFDQEVDYAEDQAHLKQRRAGVLGKRTKHGDGDAEEYTEQKRAKVSAAEHHYLELLPNADMYERSYMHKDVVCQCKVPLLILKMLQCACPSGMTIFSP